MLDSAKIITPTDIGEGRAKAPGSALTTVAPTGPLDVFNFNHRDHELAYRDLIISVAIVKAAILARNVWGISPDNIYHVTPRLNAYVPGELQFLAGDMGSGGGSGNLSNVAHVLYASVPTAAVTADKDLYLRDCLIHEALGRVSEGVFEEPPVTSSDRDLVIPLNWSLAAGQDVPADVGLNDPLTRDLFKLPDQLLAYRDNQLASYVSNLIEIIHCPFATATRLLIEAGAREAETYSLVSDDGTLRTWAAEPFLPTGLRLIYNKTLRTLRWAAEDPNVATETVDFNGPKYAFSSTSTSIAAGTAFTIPAGLPFVVGDRVRVEAESAPENYIEGVVLTYSGTTLTLTVETQEGSGTFDAWLIKRYSLAFTSGTNTIRTVGNISSDKDAEFFRQKSSYFFDSRKRDQAKLLNAGPGLSIVASGLPYAVTIPFEITVANLTAGNYRLGLLVKPAGDTTGLDYAISGQFTSSTSVPTARFSGASGRYASVGLNFTLSSPINVGQTLYARIHQTNATQPVALEIVQADVVAIESIVPTPGAVAWWKHELIKRAIESVRQAYNNYIVSFNQVEYTPARESSAVYEVADYVHALSDGDGPGGAIYKCSAGGTSTTLQPSGMSSGTSPITDGGVTWTVFRAYNFWKASTPYAVGAIAQSPAVQVSGVPKDFSGSQDYWQANATYTAGDIVSYVVDGAVRWWRARKTVPANLSVTTPPNSAYWGSIKPGPIYVYRCTAAGTSGTDPLIFAAGTYQVSDGGATWALLEPVYDADGVWTEVSTEGWMSAISVFQPRLKDAFRKSRPGDIGRPALVPLGLSPTATGGFEIGCSATQSLPALAALQPWMVAAGIYVADNDLWPTVLG